jgi:hypothetical protein
MEPDVAAWSGDGDLTRTFVDALSALPSIRHLKVEDSPASRAGAAFSFISNELFVGFAPDARMTLEALASLLERLPDIGPPDYADAAMLQYLRTERILRPYQTKGYKVVEMVRVYRLLP